MFSSLWIIHHDLTTWSPGSYRYVSCQNLTQYNSGAEKLIYFLLLLPVSCPLYSIVYCLITQFRLSPSPLLLVKSCTFLILLRFTNSIFSECSKQTFVEGHCVHDGRDTGRSGFVLVLRETYSSIVLLHFILDLYENIWKW